MKFVQMEVENLVTEDMWTRPRRSEVTCAAHLPRHRSQSQQDPPVAEDHEQERQQQAEDEQAADVGASRGRALVPLDRADGAGTLRPIAAPQ